MDLESLVATATSVEVMLCSQVATLQADLLAGRGDITTMPSSQKSDTSTLNTECTENKRLKFGVAELSSAVEEMRF